MLEAVAAARAPEELVGEADVPAHGADGGGAAVHGEMGCRGSTRARQDQEGISGTEDGLGRRREGRGVRTEEGPRRIKYEREKGGEAEEGGRTRQP